MTYHRYSKGSNAVAQKLVEGYVTDVRKRNIRVEISDAVKAFVERNGVRRFEAGASSDYLFLKAFLAERGFFLSTHRSQTTFIITTEGQRGRPKTMSWSKVIAFVDAIRQGEGREPIKRRAA